MVRTRDWHGERIGKVTAKTAVEALKKARKKYGTCTVRLLGVVSGKKTYTVYKRPRKTKGRRK